MTTKESAERPDPSPSPIDPASDRAAQRAEALRANLLRRKTQARGRAAPAESEGGGKGGGA